MQKETWKNLKLYLSIKVLFKVDVTFKTAGRFIDLDTFIKDENDTDFIKATVKSRFPFVKIPEIVKHYAIALFMIESNEVKENFPWIYNPPSFPNVGEITQGSMERENFSKTYGGYTEMVYICATFTNSNPKKIFEWETNYFLFWSEYLLRKRTVENIK